MPEQEVTNQVETPATQNSIVETPALVAPSNDTKSTVPPPNYEENKDLTLEDFFKVGEEPVIKKDETNEHADDKIDEEKGEESAPNVEVPEDGKAASEDNAGEIIQPNEQQQQQTEQVTADIAHFEKHEQEMLKRMSKVSREYVIARFNEARELKKEKKDLEQKLTDTLAGKQQVPQSYYENPNAYVLLPEFQKGQQIARTVDAIQAHWAEQLAKIEEGEEWTDLEDVLDANGNHTGQVKLGAKQPASGKARVAVMQHLQQANFQVRETQTYLNTIRQNFSSGVQTVINNVNKVEKDLFNNENWNKKDTAESKAAEGVKNGLKQLGITEANPLFNLFTKVAASYMIMRQVHDARQAVQSREAKINADAKRAGPSGASVKNGGGGAARTADNVTMDDFEKVLRRE